MLCLPHSQLAPEARRVLPLHVSVSLPVKGVIIILCGLFPVAPPNHFLPFFAPLCSLGGCLLWAVSPGHLALCLPVASAKVGARSGDPSWDDRQATVSLGHACLGSQACWHSVILQLYLLTDSPSSTSLSSCQAGVVTPVCVALSFQGWQWLPVVANHWALHQCFLVPLILPTFGEQSHSKFSLVKHFESAAVKNK